MDRLLNEKAVLDALEKYKDDMSQHFEVNYFIETNRVNDCIKLIKAIPSVEPKAEQFAKWVATEIFDDMWEYNKDAFAEIACRKLAKIGIVKANGDEWELVEPQESE